MNNLEFIGELRKQKHLRHFATNFVVQLINFEEVSDFVDLCRQKNVDKINFSFVSDWKTWSPEEFKDQCIWRKEHPRFPDLLKALLKDNLDDQIVSLGPLSPYRQAALKPINKIEP
jgi:hypothetical protein